MSAQLTFPNDENGDVLRRMQESGDDLRQSRIIDFSFTFPERSQALAFAAVVEERDVQTCISYYMQKKIWQVTVKRKMVPTHEDITSLELSLSARAKSVGGEPDGWGCIQIDRKE